LASEKRLKSRVGVVVDRPSENRDRQITVTSCQLKNFCCHRNVASIEIGYIEENLVSIPPSSVVHPEIQR
jgi:hypothetical protein